MWTSSIIQDESEKLSKHLRAALWAADGLQMGGSEWVIRKAGIFPANKNWGKTSVIYTFKRNACRPSISRGSKLPRGMIYKKSHTDAAARCRLTQKN